MTPDAELPAWERDDAFPEAGPGWGWVDRRGKRIPCAGFGELSEAIVKDAGARVDLVWTPAAKGYVLPEEVPELFPAMREARIRWAGWDIEEGKRQMKVFGVVLAAMTLLHLYNNQFRIGGLFSSATVGFTLLLFFILGFFPWYKGTKRFAKARAWGAGEMAADARSYRFETWLAVQKTPLTLLLLGLLAVVGLVQLGAEITEFGTVNRLKGWNILFGGLKHFIASGFHNTILDAGLTKVNGQASERWRLFTAPFLHGHWIHWAMNASALAYLGKRVEVFARWPHLVLCFLISAWVGGEASARFTTLPSVGASGGLMGLLGFLMVFESLHRRLVPEDSRRRLLAGVLLTGALGVAFSHFIDNAAHAGGLIAGMVYAALVFPKSSSPHRPRATITDVIFGGAAVGGLVCSAALACIRMWQG